jgi:diaminohydroxyphosphoribosylaminopyrimidine deaminase/5-amino-6-(5-phosphoribosylamino)uracil reductase
MNVEMQATNADLEYMARAIQLAERGLFSTDPNPRVGCVLVKDGAVLGEGWHVRAGDGHAEVIALQAAGERARGATAYVTLEPCCHHGKTPPCTDALIAAGVARVVVAMQDPNPLVEGKGLAQLRDAGVRVDVGVLKASAQALNPGFVSRMTRQRPYVRCKFGVSLDGRTALANGRSQWITGEAARLDVHRWRARSSAIITGVGTVLADDPRMTVREVEPGDNPRQPLRVVLDTNLSTPPTARILSQPGRTMIVTTSEDGAGAAALQDAGAEVLVVTEFDLNALLGYLAEQERCNEAWIEAGSTLAGAFLREGLIDELVLYYAPKIFGNSARGMFRLPEFQTLDEAVSLSIVDARAVGDDWRVIAKVNR